MTPTKGFFLGFLFLAIALVVTNCHGNSGNTLQDATTTKHNVAVADTTKAWERW